MSTRHSPQTVVDSFQDDFGFPEGIDKSPFEEPDDEIELSRLSFVESEDHGLEVLEEGTSQRSEQEEFQLQMAQDAFDRGIEYWTDSDFDQAHREFMQSLEIREDIRGRLDPLTAKAYLWVGTIHFHREEYERAIDNLSRSFRIQYELNDQDSKKCSVVINWINKTLTAKGLAEKKAKATFWKQQMVCVDQELKGDEHRANKNFERAIDCYRTALQFEFSRRGITPDTPGRQLVDAADLYSKIGRCYEAVQKPERAIMEFRSAYAIYLGWGGQNQRFTIQSYDNMADVAYEMGFRGKHIDEYLPNIQKSLRHEKTADWMVANKQYSEALQEYNQALQIEEHIVGRTLAACATLYFKIGIIHSLRNKPHQAIFMWGRAIGIFERILGSQHRHTTTIIKMIQRLKV